MHALRLLRYDYRLLLRDPMLIALTVLPPVLAVAVWLGLPRIAALAGTYADPVELAIILVLVMLSPLLFGVVSGLMLLEERDEGVLAAIDLTPLGRTAFVAARMVLPVLYSMAAAAFVLILFGHAAASVRVPVIAGLAGLEAPLFALFLGSFANNRIEGIALSKVGNVVVVLGALGVLAPWPWQTLAWWSPHYWLVRVLLPGSADAAAIAAAFLVHALALVALARVYGRRTR